MKINDKEFVERVTSETKILLKEKDGSVITLEFSDGIVLEIVQTKEENYGSRLWLYDKDGEGMSVNEQDFANYIREYYKKHF